MTWEQLCRRTNDPKLSFIEARLDAMGIAHKREGESRDAPILRVDARRFEEAWALLSEDVAGMGELDEIPDDDPIFIPYTR